MTELLTASVAESHRCRCHTELVHGHPPTINHAAEIADMAAPLHSNRMRKNEDGLAAGVAVHVGVAMHNLGGSVD